jgi:uncharacterized protein
MPSMLDRLTEKKAVAPPSYLRNNVHYETIMGSVAYGVSGDTSDMDIYGFAIPPKHLVFPHLAGEIPGFGTQIPRFEQFQQHHILDPDGKKGEDGEPKMYDIAIFSIVKFFQLCMENNPNMVDSLFTPQRCVLHVTRIGQTVRENRRLFLHKGSFHKFKGYAYSQLHKADIKTPKEGSKRDKTVQEHGWDLKFGYHVVRLLDECEQILTTGDLDLERAKEVLKAIRRGEWSLEQTKDYFQRRERELEEVYAKSTLPHRPDEPKIKELLLNCLEEHYGTLEGAVVTEDAAVRALRQIREILDRTTVSQTTSPIEEGHNK